MMTIGFLVSLITALITGGCNESAVDQPIAKIEKDWNEVPEFKNLDIRYMIQFKNELYASVVYNQGDTLIAGAVLKTSDAKTWSLVRTFLESVGPMTIENDSLFIMSDHYIHAMNSRGEWGIKFEVPWDMADAELVGDMAFLNGTLFVVQSRLTGFMYGVSPNGVWKKISSPPAIDGRLWGAKLLKYISSGREILFLRPRSGEGIILFQFDGVTLTSMQNGLPRTLDGFNSMVIHKDTLYAAFQPGVYSSSAIYRWIDGEWILFGDSIPNGKYSLDFIPPSFTIPTAMLFVNDDIFVATDVFGIMRKKPHGSFLSLNSGLFLSPYYTVEFERYNTISFLEYFNGYLFAGYGNPAYMWGSKISGPRMGMLKYKFKG